eukprot:TRINITY_DN2809_c1_g1_i1.p1 TRINITY_DN2809_c1_g1~~TRINITY_DN2809_c1_g1_i1.p1  ORF type:complete len:232 (-),score=57.03 TRINITY_DN2809_c1_g1_i1:151-846(-)
MSWFGGSAEPVPCVYEECETPKTEEEYLALDEKQYTKMRTLSLNDDGWSTIPLEDMEDLELFERADLGGSINAIRVVALMPGSQQECFALNRETDLERVHKWDADVIETKIHKQISENVEVMYSTHNAPFPVTNRSFVYLRSKRVDEDGAIFSTSISINDDEYPVDSNFVRGVNQSQWCFLPVEGNDKQCKLIRVVAIDPKGSIPTWIVNSHKKKGADLLVTLRKVLTGDL